MTATEPLPRLRITHHGGHRARRRTGPMRHRGRRLRGLRPKMGRRLHDKALPNDEAALRKVLIRHRLSAAFDEPSARAGSEAMRRIG
jgi:hypothetical protein